MANKVLSDLPDSDKKSIRSWYIYDWAHSAHSTSVMVAIAPVYFVNLYKEGSSAENALNDSLKMIR